MFRISANGAAIPFRYSKEISLIANVNYLFDPTVCQSTTLRKVQKTKSVIFRCVCSCSFRHRRLPDLKHPTHPIYPIMFVREAETRAVGKVSGYNFHYQTIRSTMYGTFLFKKRKIADSQMPAFRAGKTYGEVSEESFPH